MSARSYLLGGTSYPRRPAVEDVRVRGGEYSSDEPLWFWSSFPSVSPTAVAFDISARCPHQ